MLSARTKDLPAGKVVYVYPAKDSEMCRRMGFEVFSKPTAAYLVRVWKPETPYALRLSDRLRDHLPRIPKAEVQLADGTRAWVPLRCVRDAWTGLPLDGAQAGS
ncbi:MAG: hypothetical protein QXX12_01010 [Nanopusillaceae archaeon]